MLPDPEKSTSHPVVVDDNEDGSVFAPPPQDEMVETSGARESNSVVLEEEGEGPVESINRSQQQQQQQHFNGDKQERERMNENDDAVAIMNAEEEVPQEELDEWDQEGSVRFGSPVKHREVREMGDPDDFSDGGIDSPVESPEIYPHRLLQQQQQHDLLGKAGGYPHHDLYTTTPSSQSSAAVNPYHPYSSSTSSQNHPIRVTNGAESRGAIRARRRGSVEERMMSDSRRSPHVSQHRRRRNSNDFVLPLSDHDADDRDSVGEGSTTTYHAPPFPIGNSHSNNNTSNATNYAHRDSLGGGGGGSGSGGGGGGGQVTGPRLLDEAPITIAGVNMEDKRRKRMKKVSHYVLGPLLGEGMYGVVRDAIDISATPQCAAVKNQPGSPNKPKGNSFSSSHLFPRASSVSGGGGAGVARGQESSSGGGGSSPAAHQQFHRCAVKMMPVPSDEHEHKSLMTGGKRHAASSQNRATLLRAAFKKEVENLQRFHCTYIMRAIDLFSRYGKEYIVLPIAICSLQEFIHRRRQFAISGKPWLIYDPPADPNRLLLLQQQQQQQQEGKQDATPISHPLDVISMSPSLDGFRTPATADNTPYESPPIEGRSGPTPRTSSVALPSAESPLGDAGGPARAAPAPAVAGAGAGAEVIGAIVDEDELSNTSSHTTGDGGSRRERRGRLRHRHHKNDGDNDNDNEDGSTFSSSSSARAPSSLVLLPTATPHSSPACSPRGVGGDDGSDDNDDDEGEVSGGSPNQPHGPSSLIHTPSSAAASGARHIDPQAMATTGSDRGAPRADRSRPHNHHGRRSSGGAGSDSGGADLTLQFNGEAGRRDGGHRSRRLRMASPRRHAMTVVTADGHQRPSLFSATFIKGAFYQILSAVAYLHQQNLAHNDIKPANVLLFEDGSLRLTDLAGISAKYKDQGTPLFASPELCRYYYGCCSDEELDEELGEGETEGREKKVPAEVDAKACDMWCCGLVLYSLVTGKPGPLDIQLRYDEFHHDPDSEGQHYPMNRFQLYRIIGSQKTPVDLSDIPHYYNIDHYNPNSSSPTPKSSTPKAGVNSSQDPNRNNNNNNNSYHKSDSASTGANSGGNESADGRKQRAKGGSLRDLLAGLLEIDPKKRLTAEEALRHPWMELKFLRRGAWAGHRHRRRKAEEDGDTATANTADDSTEVARSGTWNANSAEMVVTGGSSGAVAAAADASASSTPARKQEKKKSGSMRTGGLPTSNGGLSQDATPYRGGGNIVGELVSSNEIYALSSAVAKESMNHAVQREVAQRVLASGHFKDMIWRDKQRHLQFVADCCNTLDIPIPPEILKPKGDNPSATTSTTSARAPSPPSPPVAAGVNDPPMGNVIRYGYPDVMPTGCVDPTLFLPDSEADYYERKNGMPEYDVRSLLYNDDENAAGGRSTSVSGVPIKVQQFEEYLHNVVMVELGYRTMPDPSYAAEGAGHFSLDEDRSHRHRHHRHSRTTSDAADHQNDGTTADKNSTNAPRGEEKPGAGSGGHGSGDRVNHSPPCSHNNSNSAGNGHHQYYSNASVPGAAASSTRRPTTPGVTTGTAKPSFPTGEETMSSTGSVHGAGGSVPPSVPAVRDRDAERRTALHQRGGRRSNVAGGGRDPAGEQRALEAERLRETSKCFCGLV